MAYFPFFIELQNKSCLVIGGGAVAHRKIEALLEFDARITVIASEISPEVYALKDRINLIPREYREADLAEAFFVIAATNDTLVNSVIAKDCRKKNILINSVDEIDSCDFLFPAYVKQGTITIGVTTSGNSPILAGCIKKIIQEALPGYYAELVSVLGEYRKEFKERILDEKQRSAVMRELTELGLRKYGRITSEDAEAVIGRQEPEGRERDYFEDDH